MKGFVFFILLIGAISFAHGQFESLKEEKLFIYNGCEVYDQATTLWFIDQDKKQLRLLILHPIEDSKMEFNYRDFVIFNDQTQTFMANPFSLTKEFRIRYSETGEIDGIFGLFDEHLGSKNMN